MKRVRNRFGGVLGAEGVFGTGAAGGGFAAGPRFRALGRVGRAGAGERRVEEDCDRVMYVICYTYIHTMHTDRQAKQRWQHQFRDLWPALKGSLAKVYKPCIRPGCPACARDDKHPAWLLSFSQQGRRKTMYVPQAMVPTLKQALRNGRKIEQLLHRTGPQLLKYYRKYARTP